MKIKTSELIGPALDWAVAKCLKIKTGYGSSYGPKLLRASTHYAKHNVLAGEVWSPSSNWSQGGPIINRDRIELVPSVNGKVWYAESLDRSARVERCNTPLIAAMRCYVASKLGEEVNIPEELL